MEKFKDWENDNGDKDKLYNQFHRKNAKLKESCAYNIKKMVYLLIRNNRNSRGKKKVCIIESNCGNILERYFLYQIPLWTGLMLSPERYSTDDASQVVDKHLSECGKGFHILPLYELKDENKIARLVKEDFFIKLLKPDLNSDS